MKKLLELVDLCENINLPVTDICDDSRKVTPGCLFVAVNGTVNDGKQYIAEAISRGAKYILLNSDDGSSYIEWKTSAADAKENILFIYVKNTRIELANVVARFFDTDLANNSSEFYNMVSVTGTNGKSSTVDIVRQIWIKDNRNAASIGTLGVISNKLIEENMSSHITSPGTIELHKTLRKLRHAEVNNVVMEASSHGIDQDRMLGIRFSICAFTNFSHDHLDYHKTMENYWNAKEKLFSKIASDKSIFVVNADCEYSERIRKIAQERDIKCVSYGCKDGSDARITSIVPRRNHQRVTALFLGNEVAFSLPLYGKFQVYNSMCAALICYLSGVELGNIIHSLEKLNPINGRLELVAEFNGAKIFIDYAHTPDALKNAILAIREYNPSGIITLFGCGGERDPEKREIMGRIAAEYSDVVVVTDDNPRGEDAVRIRKMIMKGCPEAIEVSNREKAIGYVIDVLSKDYALLIAGKGHEDYQITNFGKINFSDKSIILNKVLK